MSKIRKKRDYQSMFTGDRNLPSAEDVNKQVAKLTNKTIESAPKPVPKAKPKPEPSTRGRKPLETKKVPYTTAITKDNKFKLKLQAMKKGIRPSDMLDQILTAYFKKNG